MAGGDGYGDDDDAPKRKRRVVAPRLDEYVEQMLASMYSYTETVDNAVEVFKVDERTVKSSITRVRARWQKAEETTVEQRRAKFRANLENAWREAMDAGDFRAVAAIAKVLASIEGILAPKKIEHTGTVGLRPVAAMAPQDRDREIAELLAKRNGNAASLTEPRPSLELDLEIDEMAPPIRIPDAAPLPRALRKQKPDDDGGDGMN